MIKLLRINTDNNESLLKLIRFILTLIQSNIIIEKLEIVEIGKKNEILLVFYIVRWFLLIIIDKRIF